MKRRRFSVEQITSVLQQAAGGTAVGDVCRQVGISEHTFYRWKKEYGGTVVRHPRSVLPPVRTDLDTEVAGAREVHRGGEDGVAGLGRHVSRRHSN